MQETCNADILQGRICHCREYKKHKAQTETSEDMLFPLNLGFLTASKVKMKALGVVVMEHFPLNFRHFSLKE